MINEIKMNPPDTPEQRHKSPKPSWHFLLQIDLNFFLSFFLYRI